MKWNLPTLLWLMAYFAMLAAVAGAVVRMRTAAIAVYGTSQAQLDWNTWREDVSEMAQQPSLVNRRMPKSPEPPALVLMRDHFGVCLTIALVLSTILFGTFMMFVRGAMADADRSRTVVPPVSPAQAHHKHS